jgi:hypothetical protein
MQTRLNRKIRKKGGVEDEGEENGMEKGYLENETDEEEDDIKEFFRITCVCKGRKKQIISGPAERLLASQEVLHFTRT